ncbi:unnamed protein product [Rhizophagus irregularis]|nr:unnamed protein product [Rhizophagus irregularis]
MRKFYILMLSIGFTAVHFSHYFQNSYLILGLKLSQIEARPLGFLNQPRGVNLAHIKYFTIRSQDDATSLTSSVFRFFYQPLFNLLI